MANKSKPKTTLGISSTAGDPFPPTSPRSFSPRTTSTSTSWSTEAVSPRTASLYSDGSPRSTLSRPSRIQRTQSQTRSLRSPYGTGKRVFYMNGEVARIMDTDDTDEVHTYYTIEVNGTEKKDVHHTDLSEVHPTVNKVLDVLNLHDETDQFLKENYPTMKEFENFLNLSFEAVKAFHKINDKLKEPRFKRSDREEFIILRRWLAEEKKKQDNGTVNWEHFNEENFYVLREQAPKKDLSKVLEELGINDKKVIVTLKAKSIQSPAHFVQKSKSWYNKLEVEPGIGENEPQSKQLLLNGSEKIAIEKFKQWYLFHSIGYLPSDWIVSFRDGDIHPKERDLRKVLRVIGVNADAIEALKMNDIKDIPTLNHTSKEWRTESTRGLSSVVDRDPPVGGGEEHESRSNATMIGRGSISMADRIPTISGEQESRSNEWKDMGLTQNDARDIISFRHWHKFYVAGKSNMKGWTTEFNSAQYNNFLQRYEPGDDFSNPSRLKFWKQDSLKFSQERHDYYDMLQEAAESGDVTDKQRYHLRKYYKKREKMALIDEITSHRNEGLGDSTEQEERLQELLDLDEKKADKKDKGDLLFGQKFCQFFFSAFLVLVLLAAWLGTTVYFMMEFLKKRNYLSEEGNTLKGYEEQHVHPGFEYVTFINNVLFGLVTAVVIQELGEEASETSLYHRFLPTYRKQRRRRKEYLILNRRATRDFKGRVRRFWGNVGQFAKTNLMMIILWSTRLYIMCWIILGAVSLAFGAIAGVDTSNPLYATGQTWLGIAVTIGYTYFGLGGKNAPDANDKVGQGGKKGGDNDKKKNDVLGTHDGNGGAGQDEAGISDESEDEKKSGDKIHQERIRTTIDHRNKDAAAEGSIDIDGIDDMTGAEESLTYEAGGPAPGKFETVEMVTEEGRKSAPGYRKERSSKRSSQQKSKSRLRDNELESAGGYVPAHILNSQRNDGDRLDPDYTTRLPEGNREREKGMTNTSSTSPAAADLQKEPFGLHNSNNNTNNAFEVLGVDVEYESAASEVKEEPPDDEEPPAATAPVVRDPNRPVLEEALHRHMGLAPRPRPPREPFSVDTLGVDDLLHDDEEAPVPRVNPVLSRGDLNDEDASYPSVGWKSFHGYRKDGSSQLKGHPLSQLRENELELADGFVPARILNVQRDDRLDPEYTTRLPDPDGNHESEKDLINTSSASPAAADLQKEPFGLPAWLRNESTSQAMGLTKLWNTESMPMQSINTLGFVCYRFLSGILQ